MTSHGFRLPGINLRDGLTTILVKVLVILSLNSIPWFSKYYLTSKKGIVFKYMAKILENIFTQVADPSLLGMVRR